MAAAQLVTKVTTRNVLQYMAVAQDIPPLPPHSSSLRPGSEGFTCGKWIIFYNFGIDDGAELKFGTHEELIVLNILKYKYCVNTSHDKSRD